MRLIREDEPRFASPLLEEWDGSDEPLTTSSESVAPPPLPERILLAEDDEAIRRLYRVMLERRGFEVVEAGDGAEAVLYSRSAPFDLVIADLNMPRLDGWGLLSHLHHDCRTRDVPLAFLSNQNDFRESLRAQEVGARAYISKGTRLELIAQEVLLLCEPSRRLRRLLREPMFEPAMVGEVGAVALIREIAQARWTGVLRAIGTWAQVEIAFDAGRPCRADARSGEHSAQGATAFNAFIACDGFDGMLSQEDALGPDNLSGSSARLLDDAIAVVNRNLQRQAEQAVTGAGELAANAALYELYTRFASPEARETARRVCEEKLSPAQVIASTDRSPLDVDAELQDLHRRGLIRLRSEAA